MKKLNIILLFLCMIFSLALLGCEEKEPKTHEFLISGPTEVNIGDTISLSVFGFDSSKIAWTSSKSQIASVSNGVVTGLANGEAKIQARLGSFGASIIINVTGNSSSETSIYTLEAQQILSKMSLEEKVGQLFMVGLNSDRLSSQEEGLIKQYHFGNFYLSKDNMKSSTKTISLSQKLQEITILENGVASFIASSLTFSNNELENINEIDYPKQMIVGNCADEKLVSEAAGYIAQELASFGINFNFIYSLNTMTGDADTRHGETPITLEAFSSDPVLTSKLANAMITKINSENVVACGGLFPIFNGGEKDISKADKYFDVFKNAILSGMDALIINDVKYSLLDTVNPSTMSSFVINDFLKEKLGFNGITISTDLNNYSVPYDASVELYSRPAIIALYAGLDMFYFSSISEDAKNYYADIIEAYNKDLITIDVIDKAVLKILEMKIKYGVTKYEASKVDGRFDSTAKKKLIEKLNKYIITNVSSFDFPVIEKNEKILIIGQELNFNSGSKSVSEEMKARMVSQGYREDYIDYKTVTNTRAVRNLFNSWNENYVGDTSNYDRVVIIFPYSTSYNDYSRVYSYIEGLNNVYIICMNSLNGAWCFNEEFPTLLVYAEEAKEYQIMIDSLIVLAQK